MASPPSGALGSTDSSVLRDTSLTYSTPAYPSLSNAAPPQNSCVPFYPPVPSLAYPTMNPAPFAAHQFSPSPCGSPSTRVTAGVQPQALVTPGYMVYEPYLGRTRFYAPPSSRPFAYHGSMVPSYPSVLAPMHSNYSNYSPMRAEAGLSSFVDSGNSFNMPPVNHQFGPHPPLESFLGLQSAPVGPGTQYPLGAVNFNTEANYTVGENSTSGTSFASSLSSGFGATPAIVEVGGHESAESSPSVVTNAPVNFPGMSRTQVDQEELERIERALLVCPSCTIRFTTASEVDDHRQVHSRFKPYACLGGCRRAFSRLVGRDAHWSKYPGCKTDHQRQLLSIK